MGGSDSEDNLTYLKVREHIIAHYLLWKIYKNPNDLRSMKMLGAKLTPRHRKITGEFCRDNKIGIFSHSKEQRDIWSYRGFENQKLEYLENQTKNYYYWSTPEGRRERASLGGKKRASPAFNYWCSPEGAKERASRGGKAHKGKKVMHFPGVKGWKRIKPEDVEVRLKEGWKFGKGSPSPKLKNNDIS